MLIAAHPLPLGQNPIFSDQSGTPDRTRAIRTISPMKIHIPTPLRVYTDKQDTVGVEASTVGEALDALTAKHPDLKKHLYSEEGKLRAFVNVYLNDEDIRYLPEKEATRVGSSDALSIIPSIAGGGLTVQVTAPSLGRCTNCFGPPAGPGSA
jgi:sulfur-carrier protein